MYMKNHAFKIDIYSVAYLVNSYLFLIFFLKKLVFLLYGRLFIDQFNIFLMIVCSLVDYDDMFRRKNKIFVY